MASIWFPTLANSEKRPLFPSNSLFFSPEPFRKILRAATFGVLPAAARENVWQCIYCTHPERDQKYSDTQPLLPDYINCQAIPMGMEVPVHTANPSCDNSGPPRCCSSSLVHCSGSGQTHRPWNHCPSYRHAGDQIHVAIRSRPFYHQFSNLAVLNVKTISA